ncbi:MAG: homocysteine S-methyltransferase family protein [Oscillospiraceae bacterium]|nr:homocysteine S-methyltransferase family protein [Oscillospiraceae bacterium]
MDFRTLLMQEFVLLDGGMGTMLNLTPGEIPEALNLTDPQRIAAIHQAYVNAGSNVVYANTFGANSIKLADTGLNAAECIGAAVAIAKQAVGDVACVALDMGSTGQMLQPNGTLSFEDAYNCYKEAVMAGAAAGADLIVIETMSDLSEMRAALLAAKENSSLPVICTMSFTETGRTFTGCPVSAMAMTLEGLGADVIGINCSLGPEEMMPMIRELAEWTALPLAVKPNAGLPDPVTGAYHVLPEVFARCVAAFTDCGVQFFGGCCGTTPEYISALSALLNQKRRARLHFRRRSAVCSATRTVELDMPRVIGERINPTGKKLMQQALKDGNMDYLRSEAIAQTQAGADLLDVNVGTPGIDEVTMLPAAVSAVMEVSDLPLQLDSSDAAALEAALRIYPGKAIVNSVCGKETSLSAILPLVKRYGAAVVGLTLDENGIPHSANERFRIAERILQRALACGIPKEDVYIDCLTLTASTGENGPTETLGALRRVREELGLQTVLGVSNISFGLPNRPIVNRCFLNMALSAGLTLPIINPKAQDMMDTVRAYRMLAGFDANCAQYIECYRDVQAAAPISTGSFTLAEAVAHGMKQEAARLTAEALQDTEPLAIINEHLIPALDAVGAQYEAGTMFLPQLIQAATAAQSAFAVLKQRFAGREDAQSKGSIVIATVQGDVHDIGKNIVKLLLENYGYHVIDLGKDVPPQRIADAAAEHDVSLVGLSALMTTTVPAMAETIGLLHEKLPQCKIVVGGAVLTKEYAMTIGADCYAKDAKATVDFARMVYGETANSCKESI